MKPSTVNYIQPYAMGYNSEIRTARRRRETLITPSERSVTRGMRGIPTISALRRSATLYAVALLRSAERREGVFYPELRLRLTRGYQRGTPTVCRIYNYTPHHNYRTQRPPRSAEVVPPSNYNGRLYLPSQA